MLLGTGQGWELFPLLTPHYPGGCAEGTGRGGGSPTDGKRGRKTIFTNGMADHAKYAQESTRKQNQK